MTKGHDLRNLFILLLVVFLLFCLDKIRWNHYIGYEKVKRYMEEDLNIFTMGKEFFGEDIFLAYNQEASVNATIYKKVPYQDGFLIYQGEEELRLSIIGSVLKITKLREQYEVVISTTTGNIVIGDLKCCFLHLFDKVDTKTVIGTLFLEGEWYYYYYAKI